MIKILNLLEFFFIFFVTSFAHGANIEKEDKIENNSNHKLEINDIIKIYSELRIEITPEDVISGEFVDKFVEHQRNSQKIIDESFNRACEISDSEITRVESEIIAAQSTSKIIYDFYELLIELSNQDKTLADLVAKALNDLGKVEFERLILLTNELLFGDRINIILKHASST